MIHHSSHPPIQKVQTDLNTYYKREYPLPAFRPTHHTLINRGLWSLKDIEVRHDVDPYVLPNIIGELQNDLLEYHYHSFDSSHLHNGNSFRVKDIKRTQDTLVVYTQPSMYFDSLLTNYSLDLQVDQTNLRDILAPGPKFQPLTQSRLGNSLGCNVLLQTLDNYLVFRQRSHQTLVGRGKFGPTVSGAAKGTHVMNGSPHPFATVLHQCEEELGITEGEISQLFLSSITRDMASGGKPHFNFIGWIALTRDELIRRHQSAVDGWEGSMEFIPCTIKSITKFVRRHSQNMTDQAVLCLKDLRKLGIQY